jgi:CRISPR-associated protein Cas1
VLRAYERRLSTEIKHPVFGYRISYRRVLDVQARILAAYLIGEVPEYTPMVTR